jgi:hypothetical protein
LALRKSSTTATSGLFLFCVIGLLKKLARES